jgi:hypothetical protein
MLRKFILTAAAAGTIGLVAFATAPAQAGTLGTTGLIAPQIETDVTQVQHWRWGSRRYRPRIWAPRRCIMVHTRSWTRWRCR